MLVLLTVRKLKPGTYEQFRKAWEPTGDMPEQFEGAYHVRNVNDENEVISFGFFNGTLNDLMQLRDEGEDERQRRMAEFVESTGADGLYEVIEKFGRD
jgi:hypothetical protein